MMSKSVDYIIAKLNREIVTFSSYDFVTKEIGRASCRERVSLAV